MAATIFPPIASTPRTSDPGPERAPLTNGASVIDTEGRGTGWALDASRASHDLTDSRFIADVLKSCSAARPRVQIRTSDGRVRSGHWLGPPSELAGVYVVADTDLLPEGPSAVTFEVHGVVFVLRGYLRQHAQQGTNATIEGPLTLLALERRNAARVALPEGHAELVWGAGAGDASWTERSAVRDITPTGVGVVADESAGPLPRTAFSAELRVGDKVVPCLAYAQRRSATQGETSGVGIDAGRLRHRVVEMILEEWMPRLSPRSAIDCESMQALMRDSGYLRLRDSDVDFQAWTSVVPQNLPSYDRVYRATDGTLLGHMSATRIYSKTWLIHQLACLRGHPESGECRKSLYLFMAAIPTIHDGQSGSILAYFDPRLRWHNLFFGRFTEWTNDPSLSVICAFDRFERDAPREAFDSPAGCEVREACREELPAVCTLVRAHLPQIVGDAFDVHPANLRRGARAPERGRHVLVLRQGGELAGAALCDTGDPTVSLFNIVNMAQIYVCTGSRAPSPDAQRALVSACRAFYEARNVNRPLIVSPQDTLRGAAEPGTHLAETMGCIVIKGPGVRQWENFCRFYFDLLWPQRTENVR